MKKKSKTNLIILLALGILLALIPMNTTNHYFISDNSNSCVYLKSSNQGDSIFKLTASMWSNTQNVSFSGLDPHKFENTDVLNQIFEGLFCYNLNDPSLSIIENLANGTGTWSSDKLNFTVLLKNNVTFHDGTKFNASAVQWSFNRLAYFMNISGTLPSYEHLPWINWVYRWSDYTPIINRTEVNEVYNITFVLNRPFAAFPGLLCFQGSYILSPTSSPFFEHIDYSTVPVGTGPFEFKSLRLSPTVEVILHAFENYWRGKPQIEILRLVDLVGLGYIEGSEMLQSGELDLVNDPPSDLISDLEADPDIKLIDAGKGVRAYYLGMNNEQINKTWRQAISYSINYTYITDIIMEGQADRLKSPIPENILFANWSLDVAYYNVTKAREIMQSMGFGGGWDTTYPGTNEVQWSGATFATYNYTYNIESSLKKDILSLLQNNLDKIGINVIDAGLPRLEYWKRLLEITPYHRNMLQLIIHISIPNFNDPNNYIDTFFRNTSLYNYGLVNDIYLENLMQDGLNETDFTARRAIYNEIQRYLVEDLMPYAYLFVPHNYDAYYNYIIGYPSNPMDQAWFYNVSQNSTQFPGRIYLNGNHEWESLKSIGKCTGSGSSSDPYIIKNLVIDGQNRSRSGILIKNSDVYFEIKNCTIFNSLAAGIELNNVSNGRIIGNSFSNNNFGLHLRYSDNNTISDNTASYNTDDGIKIWMSDYNDITGNIANNNTYGISLSNDHNNTISGNTANYNYCGISLYASDNNDITGNTVTNNREGIWLGTSHNNTISGNNASYNNDGGIFLDVSNYNIVSGNTANANYDGFWLGLSHNNQISRNTANNNNHDGIYLRYYSDNNIISENTASYNNEGIYLSRSNNNTITGNIANYNNDDGITLSDSNYNSISGNSANDNTIGIYLRESNNTIVSGNTLTRNDECIVEENCHGNKFSDNGDCIYGEGGDGVEIPFELILLISSLSGGVVIGLAILLLIRRKRRRIA